MKAPNEKVLHFLIRLADGISAMFGNRCECVIHDMLNFDQSIVHIANGHVTGRSKGAEFKVLGTRELSSFTRGDDLVNCKGLTSDNRVLKTSTFHFRGEGYHYAFGINFDYTQLAFAESIIQDIIQVGEDIDEAMMDPSTNEVKLDAMFVEAIKSIGKPESSLNKQERLELVRLLHAKGALSLQKSIPYVAQRIQVSKGTIYNYLKHIKEDRQSEPGGSR